MTAATAAGTIQAGLSESTPPAAGGRATAGLRTGGGGFVVLVGVGAGGFVGTRGGSTTTTPLPSGSAGTPSPGFQTGCSIGVHMGWAGAGEGAAGFTGVCGAVGVGGLVAKLGGGAGAGGGGAVSHTGAGMAGSGVLGSGLGSSSAHFCAAGAGSGV